MGSATREAERGSEQAAAAGRLLQMILDAAETVTRQVDEIAAAAAHMQTQAGELHQAMETVSAVVEENTAATEEMSVSDEVRIAADSLRGMAEQLHTTLSRFTVATFEQAAVTVEVPVAGPITVHG